MSTGIHKSLHEFNLFWARSLRGGMNWNAVDDFAFPDRSGQIVSLRGIGGGWADNNNPLAAARSKDIYRWLDAR